MSMRWKSQQLGHEDLSLELRDIVRRDKEFGMVGWVLVVASISLHFVGVAIAVFVAQWIFTSVSQITVAILASVAYGLGVLSLGVEKIYRKMCRMEMHTLTLHDEILCNQDKLDEVERELGKIRNHNIF